MSYAMIRDMFNDNKKDLILECWKYIPKKKRADILVELCITEDMDMIAFLPKDVEITERDQQSIIYSITKNRKADFLSFVLGSGLKFDNKIFRNDEFIYEEYIPVLEVLLRTEIWDNPQRTLPRVIRRKNLDIVKLFIKYGANVDKIDYLIDAIGSNTLEIVEYILKLCPRIEGYSKEICDSLEYNTDPNILDLLLRSGLDINGQVIRVKRDYFGIIINHGYWSSADYNHILYVRLFDERHLKYFKSKRDEDIKISRIIKNKRRKYNWPRDLGFLFKAD